MIRVLFITGTDTGIGKTRIGGAISALLREEGVDIGVMKPVECGGGDVGRDASYLKKMARSNDPDEMINPYLFKEPLSPYHAAKKEGRKIEMAKITSAFEKLKSRHEITVVEGAGGLLAPVTGLLSVGDMARAFGAPLLIVSHPFLGNINHTLLTIQAARGLGLNIAGVIFNQWKNMKYPKPDFDLIRNKGGTEVFGMMPYIEEGDSPGPLVASFREHINVELFLARLGYGSS
ncbi:Dethiobiotin synthetase [hydrothermal vent metagenome]|uniref:Dethiobiotin synthetase n=1 Tax=hydrothermal vent metagenome TaxID=652676 RepID=A0A3B1C9I4_9ZZZZ